MHRPVSSSLAGVGAGQHEVTWDGRDESGRSVGSGVYFLRLKAGEWTERSKVTVTR